MSRQVFQEETQLADGQGQRIAAGDDHVADFRMIADVLDHAFVVAADGVPAAADHGGPFARAEPAIHGADVRRDQQGAIGIAMRQAGHRRILVLLQRIVQFIARRSSLSRGDGTDCRRMGSLGSSGLMREK